MRTTIFLCFTLLLVPAVFGQTVVYTDEFGAGSASNYTITKTSDDTSIQFGYDTSSISPAVPNAPNGDNIVVRTDVNIVAPNGVEAINAYLNGVTLPTNYTVEVDVYIRCPLVGGSGTTEHCGMGLFGSGTKVNSLHTYDALPNDTDGLAFGYNTDGDELYSDFFLSEGSATGITDVGVWTGPDPTPTGQFYEDYDALYDIPTNPDAYELFFNQWATVSLSYINGIVTCKINGDTYVTYTPTGTPSGKVFLLHTDPFSTPANPATASFCLFDHLVITEPPIALGAKDWEVYQ